MVIDHEFYMRLALQEAWRYQILTYPNPPVGALILDKNGKILAIEAHQKAGEEHAELRAVIAALNLPQINELPNPDSRHRALIEHHKGAFEGCTIYTTLEPCNHYGSTPPCSLLLKEMGFSRVLYGMRDHNPKAIGGNASLLEAGIEVIGPILEQECRDLITPFLKWQKNRFCYFKIATTLNGVYDGGTISSLPSRTLVHQMRDRCDLLIIGGETVRNDRPTLDARLINGKAPDVLILSHEKTFDQTIPLFQVPNRTVYIEQNLDKIDAYHLIMIEGGERMLESTAHLIDWVCLFESAQMRSGKTVQYSADFERVHTQPLTSDIIEWIKKGESS